MPSFAYVALKPDGSKAQGTLDASDRAEALRLLDRGRLQPVSLKESANGAAAASGKGAKSSAGKAGDPKGSKAKANGKAGAPGAAADGKAKPEEEPLPTGPVKLKRSQVILFTEELSDLLSAGLQLEPALKIMESREELSNIKTVTRILRQEVRDGASFSGSLRKASPSFGELFCSLAAAGEVSGALGTILRRQAQYLVTIQELQSKVMTAMIYPLFLMGAGVAVAILFVTYLIPELAKLLASTGNDLPGVAKFMLSCSDFIKGYWWLIALLVGGSIYGFKALIKSEAYAETWDRIKLDLPFFGPVLRARFYVQYLETLANLVGNGLPLLKALELSVGATINRHLKRIVNRIIETVGEGGSLSRCMKRAGFFPPLLLDMISVGEQTGKLTVSLERAAERYDKELGKKIEKISALVQPVIIVIMAGLVGTMAYMMITVIFKTIRSV